MKKLAPCIYEERYRIRAVVNSSVGRKEASYAKGTDLAEIKQWIAETKGKFAAIKRRTKKVDRRGTLSADITRYLKLVESLASYKSRRSELAAWREALGDKTRAQITEAMVRTAVDRWRSQGRNVGTEDEPRWKVYSVRTCEHRVAALRHLYHRLDGNDMPTPCDGIEFELPQTQPVYVPTAIILRVLRKLTDPKTRARLMVLASTGVRPAELMRTVPEDIDLKAGVWWIRTAKKGRRPALLLNDEMQAAVRAYREADAWGAYDTSEHAKALYSAGWPRQIRPYSVRATFGMELSKRGTDLADIQQLMGHTDVKTTRAYYVPPDDSRLAAATRGLTGRFGWTVDPKKRARIVGR